MYYYIFMFILFCFIESLICYVMCCIPFDNYSLIKRKLWRLVLMARRFQNQGCDCCTMHGSSPDE